MNEQPSAPAFNLNAVGVFIGTHGLAVFLVTYFTLFLYPKMQSERAEWIRDITELKQLVNPATRPVTANQAETIMTIVSVNFLNLLYSWQANYPSSSDNGEFFYFGRETISMPDKEAAATMTPVQLGEHLEQNINRFQRAIKTEAADRQDRLRTQFDNSIRACETQVYQLALIRFGNASLKESWLAIQETARKKWDDYTSEEELTASCYKDVEAFYRFIERHPAYQTLKKEKPELLVPPKMHPPKIRDNAQLLDIVRATILDEIHRNVQGVQTTGAIL